MTAARRIKAGRGGHRMRYATIDVDSLPIEVHGHQEGSEYNGHYHARIFHPLVASLAETGDLVDMRLRKGNAHTAEGALAFILPLLDHVEEELCQVASVRIDAGFPEEELLSGLEGRGTPYVARVKNNAVLDRMAEPYLRRPRGRPPEEPRVWFHEMSYAAASWSHARRVVLVVLEREDDLFLHHFWLITNWSEAQMPAQSLLDLYRERGTAEGHFGELMSVLDPALSSSPRQKSHYRDQSPTVRTPPGDAFAQNEVILLLNALAYNVAHAARVLMEEATGQGWSLLRVRERLLRVAARVLIHGRRALLVINEASARLWNTLWSSSPPSASSRGDPTLPPELTGGASPPLDTCVLSTPSPPQTALRAATVTAVSHRHPHASSHRRSTSTSSERPAWAVGVNKVGSMEFMSLSLLRLTGGGVQGECARRGRTSGRRQPTRSKKRGGAEVTRNRVRILAVAAMSLLIPAQKAVAQACAFGQYTIDPPDDHSLHAGDRR